MVKPALTLHLPGGVPMMFQRVPDVGEPQPFRMGERGVGGPSWGFADPVVKLRVAGPFYLATFPVTQAQSAVWTTAERIQHENQFKDHPDHPAESMDWREANRYCAWLTEVCREQMPAGWRACLPTEAEWEYACRAGTETEYYTGDGEAALTEAGWFAGNSSNSTHPVGLKAPNAFGLLDLHGNVWEWCHDAWEEAACRGRLDGAIDPTGKTRLEDWRVGLAQMVMSPRPRVLRGGSWCDDAEDCRIAYRCMDAPDFPLWRFGFRVCLVPGPWADRTARRGAPTDAARGDGGRRTKRGVGGGKGCGSSAGPGGSPTAPRSGRKLF